MNSFVPTMKVLNKMPDLNFYEMTHAYQYLGLLPFLLLPGLTYFKSFSQEQTCQMKANMSNELEALLRLLKPW